MCGQADHRQIGAVVLFAADNEVGAYPEGVWNFLFLFLYFYLSVFVMRHSLFHTSVSFIFRCQPSRLHQTKPYNEAYSPVCRNKITTTLLFAV